VTSLQGRSRNGVPLGQRGTMVAIALLSSCILLACRPDNTSSPSESTDAPSQVDPLTVDPLNTESSNNVPPAEENRGESAGLDSSDSASGLPPTEPEALPTLPTTPIKTTPKIDGTATAPVSSGQSLLGVGTFIAGEHPVKGSVTVIDDEGTPIIQLGPDFQTPSGPDLFVVLHTAKDVLSTTTPPAYKLSDDEYVVIAPLKAIQGEQDYSVPAAIILDNYNSVAIWCRRFNATFGTATLEAEFTSTP